eukprot:7382754-Prymnesium_polylepis.1
MGRGGAATGGTSDCTAAAAAVAAEAAAAAAAVAAAMSSCCGAAACAPLGTPGRALALACAACAVDRSEHRRHFAIAGELGAARRIDEVKGGGGQRDALERLQLVAPVTQVGDKLADERHRPGVLVHKRIAQLVDQRRQRFRPLVREPVDYPIWAE